MRNIQEVLEQKETELEQLRKEVDALRLVVRLLEDDTDAAAAKPEASVVPLSAGVPFAAVPRAQKANGRVALDPAVRQFP